MFELNQKLNKSKNQVDDVNVEVKEYKKQIYLLNDKEKHSENQLNEKSSEIQQLRKQVDSLAAEKN